MTAFAIRIPGSDVQVDGRHDKSVLDSCLAAGVAFPYNCRSGECGECIASICAGEVHELPGADPAVFNDTHRRQGMTLACLAYPRSDITVAVDLRESSGPPIREFDAVVHEVKRHGPTIVEVVVRTEAPVEYRAAQYFDWVLPGVTPDRSFSAANRPGSTTLEFHVRIYPGGKVGKLLARHEIAPGDVLTLRGPFGSVGLESDDYRPAILVAGGTGLAPIKAVLDAAFAEGCGRPLSFFYGTRRQEDLYHLDTMAAWTRAHPNFSFLPVLSDEPAASSWTGERGLVTEALARNVTDAFGAVAFMCGPPPMIDAAIPVLRRLGVDRDDIHYDKFTPIAFQAST